MEWRTGKQCRERYINQLDPNIKKSPWTYEEDAAIKRLHDQLGKKWSKFMDYLPGRSDNAIKNRWHVISRDNYAEHVNRSLYSAYQTVHRSPAVAEKPQSAEELSAVRMARYRGDNGEDSHHERMPPVKEETSETLDCELIGFDSTDIDFDLCSFSEDCGGYGTSRVMKQKVKSNDEGGTSPSISPRTTNDLGEANDEENFAANNSFYDYSTTNSHHSCSSHGDMSSGRESPIDLALLNDLLVAPEPATLQCNTAAALPATPDTGSTSLGTPVSPTAVAAVTSPKAKPNSPSGKDLKIQTNNSLYDFDYYFARKEGLPLTEPVLNAGSLECGSEEKDPSEQVCWKYDPNEDLALALEFLMSATASPAGAGLNSSSGSTRGSNAPPSQINRFSIGASSANSGNASGTIRSPNTSWFSTFSRDANSPANAQRTRPYSGNLASTTSLLARSGSGSSRMTCDPEVERLPVSTQPSLAARSLPVPPAGVAQSSTWQAPLQRAIHQQHQYQQNIMPEHSPMNHTHFSPSCQDAKRSRSKNPATFSW